MRIAIMLLLIAGAACASAANLVTNGGFEAGLSGWSLSHDWYAKPAGAGTSQAVLAEGEGREGGNALKIVGGGKRGIAMEVFSAYPGRYRLSGWIKCQDLGAAGASILAEWMSGDGKWISGSSAGGVSGTADWTFVESEVEAPAAARSVHLDLLVSEPNDGTVWFDDIAFERLPGGLPVPATPSIQAQTPTGGDACLEVTWDPKALTAGTIRLLIYCESQAFTTTEGLVPRAFGEADSGKESVGCLTNGTTYYVAAAAVNGDSKVSAAGQPVSAEVRDRQAPRPGWVEAYSSKPGQVHVRWSPHVLDMDVQTLEVGTGDDNAYKSLAKYDVAGVQTIPRPLYMTSALYSVDDDIPEATTRLGVRCIDGAGNVGEIAWVDLQPEPQAGEGPLPAAVWTAPPTAQLPVDANAPEKPSSDFSLSLMQGQSRGFQVMVKPNVDLTDVRVSVGPLKHENENSYIDPYWVAYHFVDYVKLEANSVATPPDELVWKAPAEYPDALSDDRARDLPAGRLQPIYIRVTAKNGDRCRPGLYTGTGTVWSPQGSASFTLSVRVEPVALPDKPRLKFVYWSSWDDPAKALGAAPDSEDRWRVLARQGELMRAHHQNSVVVPAGLARPFKRPDGTLLFDWTAFDRYIKVFQDQGVDALLCLSHMGGRTTGAWECPTMSSHAYGVYDARTGESSQIDVIDLLPSIAAHIDEMGLTDRFCVHVADEPIPQNLESYKALSARVKAAAPKLRRIDAIHVPDLMGSLEIWVPQINYLNQWQEQYRAAQQAGNELWFYIAWVPQGHYPNRMIDSHAIKPRILHWMNSLYDTTGYLHWALDRWSIPLDSLKSPGDQYICWPSKRYVANSSLRYEAEREGLEDCELMFMVRDKLMERGKTREEAQAEVERIGEKAVREFEDFTHDYAELEQVRAEFVRLLQ